MDSNECIGTSRMSAHDCSVLQNTTTAPSADARGRWAEGLRRLLSTTATPSKGRSPRMSPQCSSSNQNSPAMPVSQCGSSTLPAALLSRGGRSSASSKSAHCSSAHLSGSMSHPASIRTSDDDGGDIQGDSSAYSPTIGSDQTPWAASYGGARLGSRSVSIACTDLMSHAQQAAFCGEPEAPSSRSFKRAASRSSISADLAASSRALDLAASLDEEFCMF